MVQKDINDKEPRKLRPEEYKALLQREERTEVLQELEKRAREQVKPFEQFAERPRKNASKDDPRRIFWETIEARANPLMEYEKQSRKAAAIRKQDDGTDKTLNALGRIEKKLANLEPALERRVSEGLDAAGYTADMDDQARQEAIERVTMIVSNQHNDKATGEKEKPVVEAKASAPEPEVVVPKGTANVMTRAGGKDHGRAGMQRPRQPDTRGQ